VQQFLVCFCVLVVFPAALLHTVRLVVRLQYQFTRSWQGFGKIRPRVELSPYQHRADARTTRPRVGLSIL